jgi:hypothetical protein
VRVRVRFRVRVRVRVRVRANPIPNPHLQRGELRRTEGERRARTWLGLRLGLG